MRKEQKIWDKTIVQRYADDNFYAFTRGNMLACFTNVQSLQRTITYHEFNNGDKLCNVLADNVTAQVIRNEKRNLFLHINETPIAQWFKEQFGIGQEQRRGIRR